MSTIKKSAGRPKGTGTGKARELTPTEILRLTEIADIRDRALTWLCLGAGLRISEACSMTVGRLANDGSVLVEKSRSKSSRSRRCYVMPQALVFIRAYLATRPSAGADEPLFPSHTTGGFMTANYGVKLADKLFEKAGIVGATSHSLRRTFANNARRKLVDVVTIKEQLGHKWLNTTAEYLSVADTERAITIGSTEFALHPSL